uniref:Phospholipid/glycerol acyltransferase domain-containing protein n=2 Tax=Panagrolaimus sp. ES5 TaxID=591445 RepID=A0AC34FEE3_9BILA
MSSSSPELTTLGRTANPTEYEEWLSEIDAVGGELAWIRKRKDFPTNPTKIERSSAEINSSVLHSRQVKDAIEKEAERRQVPKEEIRKEAAEIIENMAQNFNLPSVKVVGYGVVKAIKNLFDAIYVNLKALRSLRERLNSDSIVFIPTHKTYADFLLLSLLCYHEDVTLPAIAAGSDFQQSYFLGEALRRCGAFFIRRSFGDDAFYWAIFSEYIQTHLIHADRPLEFFVEGTRSRTGKSLHPKYGLLQCLLEPYLRAQVYDLVIVPVTMNYDKILEESLYAYELLGFPKPKETTSGLLKARHILSKSFGNVYITFSEPISVRNIIEPKIDRSQLSFYPQREFAVDFQTKKAIQKFGHEIVKIHNKNNIISIWPFACMIINDIIDESSTATNPNPIQFSQLLERLQSFLYLMDKLQIAVQIQSTIENDLRWFLKLHFDLFVPFNLTAKDFLLKFAEMPMIKDSNNSFKNSELLSKSVTAIIFSNYANQAMAYIFHVGYICAREIENDFNEAIQRLSEANIIQIKSDSSNNRNIEIIDENSVHQISRLITPFIHVYTLIFRLLLTIEKHTLAQLSPKTTIISYLQKEISKVIEAEASHGNRLAFLNNELIKNAFHTLLKKRILTIKPWNEIVIDRIALNLMIEKLAKFDPSFSSDDTLMVADSVIHASADSILPRSRL